MLKKFGFDYKDVYSDQLMYQAVNAYTNEKQKEEEVKQEEIMRMDVAQEKIYFIILCVFTILSCVAVIIIMLCKLKEEYWSINDRKIKKAIDEYNRERELKTVMSRAQE